MNQKQINHLMDRWVSDEKFRQGLKKNAEGTLKSMGVELSEEECAVLRKIDWSLPDEALRARASKI